MFFKPKGWENLSEEDKAWMKQAKDLDKTKKLRACVLDNKPERILFLLGAYSFTRQEHYQAARLAVINQSAESLKAILDKIGGFNFASDTSGDQEGARRLFKCVTPEAFMIWKILCVSNKKNSCGQLDEQEIIKMIPPKMSHDFLRFHLDETADSRIFESCIEALGLQSTENLKFILVWSEKFSNTQDALDGALVSVIKDGDAEKAQILLEKKADPNYSGCLALRSAIEKDHQEIIDLLLPHIKLENHGENLLIELKKKNIAASKMEWLEKSVNEAVSAANARKISESYALVDANTLSETKQLTSGMKLTTLFNFKSGQQILIVEKTGEQNSLAVAVKGFDEIGDQVFLETMRRKFIDMGGKADGITRLPKTKFTRG
jgi:hypothetical protein